MHRRSRDHHRGEEVLPQWPFVILLRRLGICIFLPRRKTGNIPLQSANLQLATAAAPDIPPGASLHRPQQNLRLPPPLAGRPVWLGVGLRNHLGDLQTGGFVSFVTNN